MAEVTGRPAEESLQAFLRAKQTLLLDNFEQVLGAAPLVADLLAAAPGLKVLVTSRAVLHLYGEHEFAAPPLGLPPALKAAEGAEAGAARNARLNALAPSALSAADLTQYDAVKLFIARAQAAKAGFTISNDDTPAVAEICF